jgi:hypothetical protein
MRSEGKYVGFLLVPESMICHILLTPRCFWTEWPLLNSVAAVPRSALPFTTKTTVSGSWFRASAMITMNKNQPDAQ